MKQKATLNWVDWYDIQQLIVEGSYEKSQDAVLLVDVGGGEGHYSWQFRQKFPEAPGRVILQDLPQVIASIKKPPNGVELAPHDFFTPQPVKGKRYPFCISSGLSTEEVYLGARTYFMHWILHDWSDERSRAILTHIFDAMEPGYSRLIIHESILPNFNCDLPSACMSIMMMVQVAAFERSESQWRDLLNSVGLTNVKFWQPPGSGEGIIEAIR